MTDEKRGPLADQLAQARRDAADRAADAEAATLREAGSDPSEDAPASRAEAAPRRTKRAPEVVREVRLGIEVLTNMRHEPPAAPPGGWEPAPRRSWRVWRPGVGRVL